MRRRQAALARERVLRRFHRAQAAEGAAVAGSGLGLSIAQTIAQMHGAQLALLDAPRLGGLRVQLALPRA